MFASVPIPLLNPFFLNCSEIIGSILLQKSVEVSTNWFKFSFIFVSSWITVLILFTVSGFIIWCKIFGILSWQPCLVKSFNNTFKTTSM